MTGNLFFFPMLAGVEEKILLLQFEVVPAEPERWLRQNAGRSLKCKSTGNQLGKPEEGYI